MEIVTKKMKLKDVYPNLAKVIASKYELKEDDVEFIRKGISIDSRSYFSEGEKASVDYITTKKADRDGQIVVPSGIDFSEYRMTPVVLWCHDYKSEEMPIGKNIWIKSDEKGIIAKTVYHTRPGSLGEKVYNYLADGFPLASSIGFVPIEVKQPDEYSDLDIKSLGLDLEDLKKAPNGVFTKSLLLEYSRVPVASNAHSINIAVSKGLLSNENILELGFDIEEHSNGQEQTEEKAISENEEGTAASGDREEKEVVTKPETTENYHHIPVSEGHDGHKIRTIKVTDGIKALYCVECKEIKTYLFDVDKFTMEEARQWIQDHKKAVDTAMDIIDKDEEFDGLDLKLVDEYEEVDINIECGKEDEKPCDQKSKEDEVEEEAYREPKKEFEEIQIPFGERVVPKEFQAERWNKSLSKTFDIQNVPSKPASYTMQIYCAFLECKVKNVYMNDFFIPSPLLGSYLAGFKNKTNDFTLKDVRAFSKYEQLEFPPVYEVIQINSKTHDDFLIDGSAFYEIDGVPVVLSFTPDRYGLHATIYTSRKYMDFNKDLMKSVHEWVEKENPLKDEKMGLNGEFLDIDPADDWDTIVLSDGNLKAAKHAQKLIDEKEMGFDGRGMLMLGKPGTGKTKVSRILMSQTKHTFIWVSSKDLTNTYYPEDKIALGFKLARKLAPSILCLEDIDNWINGKIVDMMKTELDGVKKNTGVITIMTTNSPEKLPDALLDRPGRFSDILHFDSPTKELRQQMIEKWIGEISEGSMKSILETTEGYSGAYMWELIQFAKTMAEDHEMAIEDALVESLEKLIGQKDLIAQIRGEKKQEDNEPEEKEIDVEDIAIKAMYETLEKSGRTISSRNQQRIREAIETLSSLIDAEEKVEEVDIEVEQDSIDPEEAKSALQSIVKDFLSERPDVQTLIDERIKRAQGRMF